MEYRKNKKGELISLLGYGCMRFSKKGGGIDVDKAEREITRAVELGVNYFDTAYIYPGSEAALGEIVSRTGIRDRINIATKLPQYLVRSLDAADRYLEEELKRLKTDRVDYYLMHMLTDYSQWERLKEIGIESWIDNKKKEGLIRNIAFSFHGNTEMFQRIVSDYPWDLCQVQYNYLDETSQAGRAGVQKAASLRIPVVIMEPLRGGNLAGYAGGAPSDQTSASGILPKDAEKLISDTGLTPAALGLKWLYDQPEITCVLSGMNSVEMVEENCHIASESPAGSMTERERHAVSEVKRLIESSLKVGCTGCRYCMPCPQGVDIPGIFSCYNAMYLDSKSTGRAVYSRSVALRKTPGFGSRCIECHRCEKHCPQGLPISVLVKKADRELRPLPYKIVSSVMRKIVLR